MNLERLSNEYLIYGDNNYIHSVNYRHFYNAPITLNYGEKHNKGKYIISSGTSDIIELWKDGVYIYVLGQNNGLGYVSLDVINTETKEVENSVFLNNCDCTSEDSFYYGILDMGSKEQIKILSECL